MSTPYILVGLFLFEPALQMQDPCLVPHPPKPSRKDLLSAKETRERYMRALTNAANQPRRVVNFAP